MTLTCRNLVAFRGKLEQLQALLPAAGAAACGGGGGGGKGDKLRAADNNLALKMDLKAALRNLLANEARTETEREIADVMLRSYGGAPTEGGSEHWFDSPRRAPMYPGVIERAVTAMNEFRASGAVSASEAPAGYDYPKLKEQERVQFGDLLANDLARAREWVREFVATPEEDGGKRWETGRGGRDRRPDGTTKSVDEVADHLERVLGIQVGQRGDYNDAMRKAAGGLMRALQNFVDAYDPQSAAARGVPKSERMQLLGGDARTADGYWPEDARLRAWEAVVLRGWFRRAGLTVRTQNWPRTWAGLLRVVEWGKERLA